MVSKPAAFTGVRSFDPVPSLKAAARLAIEVATAAPDGLVVGTLVSPGAALSGDLGIDWAALEDAGFEGSPGTSIVLPRPGRARCVLVGVGEQARVDTDGLRDAGAAVARATQGEAELAVELGLTGEVPPDRAVQAVVEGMLLARYRYDPLKAVSSVTPLSRVVVVVEGRRAAAARRGAARATATAEATQVARDLANTPPALLTASRLAEVAADLGAARGLTVEVFDRKALVEMGCGGVLGVNAGSTEEPRVVKLSYAPEKARLRLALVGKGITYDAGGIALKPADEVHATMKNDMSGAGAILAAMSELQALGCKTAVTGYLMCTDNRPSGSSMAMGDVLTVRGGKTVEVINTDAEGRLVLADGMVMANEEPVDAIVDIATLTGAAMRALGTQIAAILGNNSSMLDQVRAAAAATGESVWELPLERRYRGELNSDVADIKNLGGANAGSITAALFLEEFAGGKPWAHIDIAGTAQNDRDTSWRPPGCTGFGARLLIELCMSFARPGR
jgi:leucyl aminopeptidase